MLCSLNKKSALLRPECTLLTSRAQHNQQVTPFKQTMSSLTHTTLSVVIIYDFNNFIIDEKFGKSFKILTYIQEQQRRQFVQ